LRHNLLRLFFLCLKHDFFRLFFLCVTQSSFVVIFSLEAWPSLVLDFFGSLFCIVIFGHIFDEIFYCFC
jgi:hypothetical protein